MRDTIGQSTKKYVGGILVVIVSLGALWGCGGTSARVVRLGAYVSQLCEAIGPFESDAHSFGRVLSRYDLRLKSHESRGEVADALAAVAAGSRHIVTTMQALGTPDIRNGRAIAGTTLRTFDAIAASDAVWSSELRAGVWRWPTTSRIKRERTRTSLEAFIEVGRLFESLPDGPETQDAMAASPVCREQFGSVPFQAST